MEHPYSEYVEDVAFRQWPRIKHRLTFRHVDLEQITDDPGNTGLYLTMVGVKDIKNSYGYDLLVEDLDKEKLAERFFDKAGEGGPGDYEELVIFTQNNEIGLLINYNK